MTINWTQPLVLLDQSTYTVSIDVTSGTLWTKIKSNFPAPAGTYTIDASYVLSNGTSSQTVSVYSFESTSNVFPSSIATSIRTSAQNVNIKSYINNLSVSTGISTITIKFVISLTYNDYYNNSAVLECEPSSFQVYTKDKCLHFKGHENLITLSKSTGKFNIDSKSLSMVESTHSVVSDLQQNKIYSNGTAQRFRRDTAPDSYWSTSDTTSYSISQKALKETPTPEYNYTSTVKTYSDPATYSYSTLSYYDNKITYKKVDITKKSYYYYFYSYYYTYDGYSNYYNYYTSYDGEKEKYDGVYYKDLGSYWSKVTSGKFSTKWTSPTIYNIKEGYSIVTVKYDEDSYTSFELGKADYQWNGRFGVPYAYLATGKVSSVYLPKGQTNYLGAVVSYAYTQYSYTFYYSIGYATGKYPDFVYGEYYDKVDVYTDMISEPTTYNYVTRRGYWNVKHVRWHLGNLFAGETHYWEYLSSTTKYEDTWRVGTLYEGDKYYSKHTDGYYKTYNNKVEHYYYSEKYDNEKNNEKQHNPLVTGTSTYTEARWQLHPIGYWEEYSSSASLSYKQQA